MAEEAEDVPEIFNDIARYAREHVENNYIARIAETISAIVEANGLTIADGSISDSDESSRSSSAVDELDEYDDEVNIAVAQNDRSDSEIDEADEKDGRDSRPSPLPVGAVARRAARELMIKRDYDLVRD